MQRRSLRAWSARVGRSVYAVLGAEPLERREVLSGDGLAVVAEPAPTAGPTLQDVLSAPTYGPMYPIQIDHTQRLVAPVPTSTTPSPTPSPAYSPSIIDQIFASLAGAEGEEPGGGEQQPIHPVPIIDEFYVWEDLEIGEYYFIGHLSYTDPDPFVIRFDTLLEGHSTNVDFAGHFIHVVNAPNGMAGVVGARAYGPNGLQSNRVEVTI